MHHTDVPMHCLQLVATISTCHAFAVFLYDRTVEVQIDLYLNACIKWLLWGMNCAFYSPVFAELDAAHIHPRVVSFQVTADQATQLFQEWHKSKYLSPGGLTKAAAPLRQAALPFWLYEARLHIYYKGSLLWKTLSCKVMTAILLYRIVRWDQQILL